MRIEGAGNNELAAPIARDHCVNSPGHEPADRDHAEKGFPTMKRREGKFVHASPRLSPNQIEAAARLHETQPRPIGRRIPSKVRGATPAPRTSQGRIRR
jgi:hypothetical protein